MTQAAALDDTAVLARGGRTNLFGFFLRLAARIPFLFIAGRAESYGAAALGRFASALVVIELTAMVCTLGEKRGLAQRLSEADDHHANVVADGTLVALIASSAMALLFWLFTYPDPKTEERKKSGTRISRRARSARRGAPREQRRPP